MWGRGGVAVPEWRRRVAGSLRRRAEGRRHAANDRHNFLAATMRTFLVVSPPGKLQVI